MSWLSEAHSEWHFVNGWGQTCPLDCGAGESYDPLDYMTDEEIAEYDAWASAQPTFEATADPFAPEGYNPPF